MKVWITRYALSGGIIEEEVEACSVDGVWKRPPPNQFGYLHPGDYETTREDAVAKAEAKRDKKIVSLKKQIAKLEKMNFGD